eukprot:5513778-Pyramimonas_sp.AAC.1
MPPRTWMRIGSAIIFGPLRRIATWTPGARSGRRRRIRGGELGMHGRTLFTATAVAPQLAPSSGRATRA